MAASNNRSTEDDGINLYTTPPWATRVFLEKEKFAGGIWECACGMGHISEELVKAGYDVQSTDLYNHGYGDTGIDFLEYTDDDVSNVITNPPFDKKGTHFQMLKHALSMENVRKVALFMPMQFLETPDRAEWLEACTHFSKVYSFVDRVKCLTRGEAALSKDNTAKHFAWFVFDKDHDGSPATVHFLYKPDELRRRKRNKK